MAVLNSFLRRALLPFVALGALWLIGLLCLLSPGIQRNALYAHRINPTWFDDLNRPEAWGFLQNQVQPFNIETVDGEVLYAWHVLPLRSYDAHKQELSRSSGGLAVNASQSVGIQALKEDSKAWLLIFFHGNAGTVAQGWRPDMYRSLALGASERIHVLAFDYRGFGYSTGTPTEAGLIADGIAVVNWALKVAGIPSERIVLVGQSLGTAVATAVAEHFVMQATEFAGLILVAGFADLPSLLLSYAIGGVVPILSPLKSYPMIQQYFVRRTVDRWPTADRLGRLVETSEKANLVVIHALNDREIPSAQSDKLFYAAVNATSDKGLSVEQIDGVKLHEDSGPAGWSDSWKWESTKGRMQSIRLIKSRYGGHNRIMTYAVVAAAVRDVFELSCR